eukprot:EG_transcript_17997
MRLALQLGLLASWSVLTCLLWTAYLWRYDSDRRLEEEDSPPWRREPQMRFAAAKIQRAVATSGKPAEDSVPESHVDEPGAEEADEEAELADSQAPRSDPPSKPLSKGEDVEDDAEGLRRRIERTFKGGKFTEAHDLYAELTRKHPHAAAIQAKSLQRVVSQLQVVGKPAPSPGLAAVQWLTTAGSGEGQALQRWSNLVVLYFWEMWCPHCRKHLKQMQEVHVAFGSHGLLVLGLTRMTKGVQEHSLRQLLTRTAITFPVGRETGDLSRAFAVRGVPAAAVVANGTVVWRGHPAHLTDRIIAQWLSSPRPTDST